MSTLTDSEQVDNNLVLRQKFIRFLNSNKELRNHYARIIGNDSVCAWKSRNKYLPLLIVDLEEKFPDEQKYFFGENKKQIILWNLRKFL